jgi:hypothetical protein
VPDVGIPTLLAGHENLSRPNRIGIEDEEETMSARIGLSRSLATAIVAVSMSVIWFAGGLSALADDPPGNNGTVRVAGEDLAVGNDSHVACAFAIDLYGYDEGDFFADITIEGQEPTGGGTLWIDRVFIGEDAAGGATDLDASAPVDLSGALAGVPHVEQGFHVMLTANADGSQGADTKHKTFWVDCASDYEGESEGGSEGSPA